ncbi:hypothetical protein Syun_008174 [Stephania yunnanensis]|uniref:DYW domain-containing protein n=1 Tax=Stephania yunnanensis TaxID=152371 RepID=A0AAP0KZW1_9MAGN
MVSKPPTSLPSHLGLKFLKIYAHSGDLHSARRLFDKIADPDLRLWTILISAHTKHGLPRKSIELYTQLRNRSIEPDKLVLLTVAKACAVLSDVVKAKEIHEDAVKFGFSSDLTLCNAFIDMYGKCRHCQGARNVFNDMPVKDVISWTSMSACYVNNGSLREALEIIRKMCLSGSRPNSMTLSSVLPACSGLKDLNSGREIHAFAIKNGMGENLFVSSGLINLYANCSSFKQAQVIFENMPRKDTVSWNVILSMYISNGQCEKALQLFHQIRGEGVELNVASWNSIIGGCMQNGLTVRALDLFAQMQEFGFKPNYITVASILPACHDLEMLRGGREIHGFCFKHCIFEDMLVGTALVFMYAKCGDLEISERVFERLPRKDTVAWNTMILANSMHGNGEEALSLFRKMMNSGVKPNAVTFTAVLSGCSHSHLVKEAKFIFNSMRRDHMVKPDGDHYSCMVDVLSRAGHLNEAYDFIRQTPIEPTAGAWGALLAACRVYKNVDLARIAAKQLFEIEPDNPGNYVLLSNIYVTAKLWNDASEIRKLMRDRGVTKMPGCSWIQVNKKVYTFVAADKRNIQSEEIYEFLQHISEKMRHAGYSPNTDFVLQDVDQEEKVEVLCSHSEKLAVAFGILNLTGDHRFECLRT